MRIELSRTRRPRRNERLIAGVACLLAALCALSAEPTRPQALLPAKVTKINDGDSIEVMLAAGAGRVRLSAIDTPEYDQPHGAESSAALKSFLPVGSAVELEVVTQDKFLRIVAVVWFVDAGERVNVNEKMLRAGHAWAYRRYMPDARFCDVEAEARDAKRGLWAQPVGDWIYPPEWRFLRNGEIRALPTPYVETRATCAAVMGLAGAATY
jgi:endonuclease YncB( thermonuclease family)